LALKTGAISVDVDLAEAERIVNLYRSTYPEIKALWRQADEAIKHMATGREHWFGNGIMLKCDTQGVHLPNGMLVRYLNLRYDSAEKTYLYDGRYGPIKLYGAKLVENVVQALARIVVFNQMATIDKKLRSFDSHAHRFKLVLTVHDEVVCVVPTSLAEKFAAFMVKVMSKPPNWGSDLPIACEVAFAQNYMECK
jgi:DNA polymerase